MKVAIFYSKFLQNVNKKRFNCSMSSKISPGAKCPIASVYLYNNYFIYKNMLIFKEFFKTQSGQNDNDNDMYDNENNFIKHKDSL